MTHKTEGSHKEGMIDVGHKDITDRTAVAAATVCFSAETFKALVDDQSPKGNVLETAKVAAVLAAKATPQIIPLCHPLEISKVKVIFKLDKKKNEVHIESEVKYFGRTGVEMEALTACSAAALTIYDMMKWKDKAITIKNIQLVSKSGGKSGDYKR